jgi:hypothetical protein
MHAVWLHSNSEDLLRGHGAHSIARQHHGKTREDLQRCLSAQLFLLKPIDRFGGPRVGVNAAVTRRSISLTAGRGIRPRCP